MDRSLAASERLTFDLSTIRWAVGVFYMAVGAMMLITPNQFGSSVYVGLQPHLGLWGAIALLLGVGLLGVAVLQPARHFEVVAHLLAGTGLLVLASGFIPAGSWTGLISFGTLGLGMVLSSFLVDGPRERLDRRSADFLPLSSGMGAAAVGVLMLSRPEQFDGPVFDSFRPWLASVGLSFLIGGLAAVFVQFRPGLNRTLYALGHLMLGGALLAFCLVSSLPLRAWLGVAYYGGFGLTIALLPWLGRHLRGIDPSSLQTRLALAFALATTLPLVAAVAIITDLQERSVTTQTLAQYEALAATSARGIEDSLDITWTAVAQLATQPDLARMPRADQRAFLKSLKAIYPDVLAFAVFDAAGDPVARSDDLAAPSAAGYPVFEDARRTKGLSSDVYVSPVFNRPVFSFGAPIIASDGTFAGAVVATLEPGKLSSMLAESGGSSQTRTLVVDGRGQFLASSEPVPNEPLANVADTKPVSAMLESSREGRGSLIYRTEGGARLMGYARLPKLGWGVIVDRPESSALADVHAGRDLSFVILLSWLILSLAAGIVAAGRLARPLVALANVVDRFTSGDLNVPIPRSNVSQIRRLASAFGEMRDTIAVEAADREYLLAAEQRARGEAEAAVRVRDEFISVAAHELKTPVTSLQGFSQVLLRELDRTGSVDPTRLATAMERMCQQSKRLTKLSGQLLNLSRLQSGKLDLHREETDLVALVSGVVATARESNPERRIDLSDNAPIWLRIDGIRIEQVLTNLLDNAIKFSPADSPIEVTVDANEPDSVRISVRDYGIGIPASQIDRVFERFHQAHPERHYGGMGIGLFISQQIVRMHEGSIWVEQPADSGSRFTVRLPRRNDGYVAGGDGHGK